MGLLARILTGGDLRAGVPSPLDDYWYNQVGTITESGMRVDKQGAQMLSAWYRGRIILAGVLAMLPLQVYRKLPNDGGAEPATDHPLYDLIHDKPNDFQSSYEYRLEQMFAIIDHGWAYSWIVPGARGFAHQLSPIDPTLVTPKQQYVLMPNGARVPSRWLFDIRDPLTNEKRTFTQDEVFYLRGAGGKGILEYARSSLGTALATESYAANIFSRGTLNGGVIENPGTLDPEASKRMAESFVTSTRNWHWPKILEQGSTFRPNDMTPEDAQMLLSRKYTVDDIARWLGVPRLMLENSDPSFGNAEQFTQNFIEINMGGWLALWEFGINDQLILARPKYFAQFKRQALVRGNFKDRIDGLVLAAGGPIMTADEARAVEDLNTLGGKAGTLRENQNVTGKPAASPSAAPAATPAPADDSQPSRRQRGLRGDTPDDRIRAIVTESARRLMQKELTASSKAAVKFAADADGFERWATAFYAEHVALVAQTLVVDEASAWLYCDSQRDALVVGGVAVATEWTTDYLVGLALDAPRADPRDAMLMAAIERPAAPIQTNTTIERGAIAVSSPVTVQPAAVTATTTIQKGAIQLDAPVTITQPQPGKRTITKTVKRDDHGGIAEIVEEES